MIPLKDDIRTVRFPIVTVALIAANALAFLWQLQVGLDVSALRGGAIPFEILTFQDVYPPDIVAPPLTILTSMFLHGGWLHIGFNMLTLWIFGNNVEDALGRTRFVAFYLLAGVAAAITQAVASTMAGYAEVPMVGASGAIAGVLAAYLLLFPYARVLTAIVIVIFVRLVYLPARLFIIGWFVLQVLPVVFGGGTPGGGVAFFAHIGGFLSGLVLVKIMGRSSRWRGGPMPW